MGCCHPFTMKKALPLVALCVFTFLASTHAQVTLPYINSFDTGSAVGWTHYAGYGTDNWQLGVPTVAPQNYAYSTPNCWKTNLSGNYTANSGMYLQTPAFDFSASSTPNALSFWHWRTQGTSTYTRIEYSVDGGNTWTSLYTTNQGLMKNWHSNAQGWTGNSGLWQQSCYSLAFLTGQSDVRLRFVLTSGTATNAGWMIDNFYVGPEYFNIYPSQGDTIARFSANMPTFTVTADLNYSNQYSATFANTINYYLSDDAVFDAGDTLLATFVRNQTATVTNYAAAVPTPPNLHSGTYYVFIETDAPDNLSEDNETDNVNFAVLQVDSTISIPYLTGFEDSTELQWKPYVAASGCTIPDYWVYGTPYRHHLDGAHSGSNAWSSSDAAIYWQNNGCGGYLETPFLDLTTASNPVMAFWYTNYGGGSWISSPSYIRYSVNGSTPASLLVTLGYSANDDWDYQVVSLAALVNQENIKFGVFTNVTWSSGGDAEGIAIDDVYIGPPLADVSVEGEKADRFTGADVSADTIRYWFVNSGIGSAAGTTTYFFWSTDSIFDAGDILLGSKAEPAPADTSGIWTYFAYTKPTNAAGRYFVFYVADSLNAVAEMREYNNRGAFEIRQENVLPLPYSNDFETQITGWRHTASLGADDWNWGSPTGSMLDSVFSGTKAWITNAHGDSLSHLSRFHLYTPVFDFTSMAEPVIEFDLIHYPWMPYNWTTSGGNMSYSVDGGATWIVLDTTSQSFKEWYYPEEYESYGGSDDLYYLPMTNQYLFADEERTFVPTNDYQTRDTRRTTHFVLDISFLAGQPHVQFRYNYAAYNSNAPGMLMDNFSITTATVDFVVDYHKNLMWSPNSNALRFYTDVLNNGNSRSPVTQVSFLLSADSLLDGSDVLLGTETVNPLRPEYSQLINKEYNVGSWVGMNYLLIQSDPIGAVSESDETNNVTAWNLGFSNPASLPYLNNFSDSVIDGWTWYHTNAIYDQYRFRHKEVAADPVYQCETDMWFLDRIENTLSSNSWIPIYYLETPTYNFTGYGEAELSFDLLCVGSGGSNSSGGNIEYSIDGGNTWTPLNAPAIQDEVNWYNGAAISTLNGAPGWSGTPGDTMMHCFADISFLSEQPDVKFRFTFKSKQRNSYPGVQGMRVDNFSVNAFTVDYVAIVTPGTVVNANVNQPFVPVTYDIVNTGTGTGQSSYTNLYWSADTLLDAGDALLYSYSENPIPASGTINSPRNIYYPQPVAQLNYYLFYFTDADSATAELSESNNVTYFNVVFDSLNIGIHESKNLNSATLTAQGGDLYLETDFSNGPAYGNVLLFDARGALVFEQKLDIASGTSRILLTSALSTGLYSMMLSDENGNFYTDQTILLQP